MGEINKKSGWNDAHWNNSRWMGWAVRLASVHPEVFNRHIYDRRWRLIPSTEDFTVVLRLLGFSGCLRSRSWKSHEDSCTGHGATVRDSVFYRILQSTLSYFLTCANQHVAFRIELPNGAEFIKMDNLEIKSIKGNLWCSRGRSVWIYSWWYTQLTLRLRDKAHKQKQKIP